MKIIIELTENEFSDVRCALIQALREDPTHEDLRQIIETRFSIFNQQQIMDGKL